MLKIHSLTLAFVFIQATGHHAFIPTLKSNQFGSNTKSGVPVIQSFSTTLADSDRDVGTFRSENEAIVDVAEAKLEENEYFAKEITRQILSDRLDYGENPEDNQLITLTTNNIISVLTYHSQQQSVDGAETIDKILGRLEEIIDVGENTYFKLHCGHYTIAVTAWSKSGHPHSAERATGIVNRMKERNIALNEVTYNAWMHAYMIKNNISMVEEIFQNMKETIPTKIRVQEWNILLLAHAKQGRPKEAEEIVKTMVRRYNSGTSEVLPDLISYSILLDAWSKSDEEGRGFRAETILDSIEERDISFDKTTYAESTASSPYVAAMRTIIHSGEENIVERVESIYKRVLVLGVAPDAYIYATLLEAYASARSADASKKVSEVLAMMEEKLNDISIEDKTVVYNTALKLLKQSREPNSIDRAEELFMTMKSEGTADEFTYGTMLALYTNKDGNSIDSSSSQRTEELLKEITSEKGINKNTLHMNIAMNSLIKAGKIKEAVGMLEEMEEEYRNGNYFLQPNTVTYSNLMHGWIKSNDPQKSKQAVVVYDKMIAMFKSGNTEAKPNFVSYVTLVDSIVKSGEVGAAERAEKIVRDMYQSYKRGESNFKPNAQLVSTVIDCWSKSRDNNAGERAEMLLNWLIEIYEEEQDEALMPKAYPFTSSIAAWAKSRKFGKASRAKAIFDQMKFLFSSGVIKSKPNIFIYTAVINACAYTERDSIEQRDGLRIFVSMYKEMISDDSVVPNHVTFITVLTALKNLLPADEKRANAVGTVFKNCTELGVCNHSITKLLQSLLSTEQLKELVGDDRVDDNGTVNNLKLPKEWTQNVKP